MSRYLCIDGISLPNYRVTIYNLLNSSVIKIEWLPWKYILCFHTTQHSVPWFEWKITIPYISWLKAIPCELKVPGLQSRKCLEKWTKTRSLSWVSPVRLNCFRNLRSATSRVSPSKKKYLRYSSATTRLKSLLRKKLQWLLTKSIKA